MKPLSCLLSIALFTISTAQAEVITIPGVKVSITDASAAAAREKAIAQGHRVAFQKALEQLGLTSQDTQTLPSDHEIMAMAKGFSPDIEKQTSTSYAASFTFHFDDQTLMSWAQGTQQTGLPPQDGTFSLQENQDYMTSEGYAPSNAPERYIQLQVPLHSFAELVNVEKMFGALPTVRGNTLKSLTQEAAVFELRVAGETSLLNTQFSERGWQLQDEGSQYRLTPQFQSHI